MQRLALIMSKGLRHWRCGRTGTSLPSLSTNLKRTSPTRVSRTGITSAPVLAARATTSPELSAKPAISFCRYHESMRSSACTRARQSLEIARCIATFALQRLLEMRSNSGMRTRLPRAGFCTIRLLYAALTHWGRELRQRVCHSAAHPSDTLLS